MVMAMQMGGDDLLAKPFDLQVLSAKVQAMLRRAYDFAAAPALLTMVPAAVFCLGAGWTLGRRSPALVYAAMGAALLLCWLPLPRELAFSPQDFFTQYPMGQEVLDPAFSVTGRFLLGRAAWTAAGIAPLLGRLLQRRGGLESC